MTVHAIWKSGHVVIDEAVDWPEGCRLEIRPASECETVDDNESTDPEAIARWVAAFEAIPPLDMTEEEEAEWQAARRVQREFEMRTLNQRAARLDAMIP
jgi:hypothetical protein